jgi:carboxypeptidase Taq
MNDQLAELRLRLGEVSDLRSALALLEWTDGDDAAAGAAVRAERLATLEQIAHERLSDERIGELVHELSDLEASLPTTPTTPA